MLREPKWLPSFNVTGAKVTPVFQCYGSHFQFTGALAPVFSYSLPISDHQVYFCTMNENFDRSKNAQKYVELEVEFCNQENMDKFKNEIANADLYNKLDLDINTDPNYNYEIFSKHLQAAKSKHIPKKFKKFNKRKHKKR